MAMSDRTEPPTADVLVRVRGALPSLPPAELRVAQVALRDPAGTAQLSITALADRGETSVATVMRFCRAIGLSNYPQLRLALAGAAAREDALGGDPRRTGDLDADDSLAQVVEKIIYGETRALAETGANLDIQSLERAVEAIVRARRIDIFGVGASGFVGQDLHQKLHRIGLMAFIWTDQHAALTAAALLKDTDVAIGISYSGTTTDTIEPLQAAAEHGATTIAVTNFAASPIAGCADLVLTTTARETPFRSGATASRIAQLAVMDCIFVGVAQRTFDTATAALTSTYDAVERHRVHQSPSRRPSSAD